MSGRPLFVPDQHLGRGHGGASPGPRAILLSDARITGDPSGGIPLAQLGIDQIRCAHIRDHEVRAEEFDRAAILSIGGLEQEQHGITRQKAEEFKERWSKLSDREKQDLIDTWKPKLEELRKWLEKGPRIGSLKDAQLELDFTMGAQAGVFKRGKQTILKVNPWGVKTGDWNAVRTLRHEASHAARAEATDPDQAAREALAERKNIPTEDERKKDLDLRRKKFVSKWLEDEAEAMRDEWAFDDWLKENVPKMDSKDLPTQEPYEESKSKPKKGERPDVATLKKKMIEDKEHVERAERAFDNAVQRAEEEEKKPKKQSMLPSPPVPSIDFRRLPVETARAPVPTATASGRASLISMALSLGPSGATTRPSTPTPGAAPRPPVPTAPPAAPSVIT